MMSTPVDHDVLLKLGRQLLTDFEALHALDWISPREYKKSNDVVTKLDLELQEKIKQQLANIDPKCRIFSEEEFIDVDSSEECWLIDPLDGTANFVQGVRQKAISLAKVSGRDILAGLVVDLDGQDIYVAIKKMGSRINGYKIQQRESVVRLLGCSTGYLRESRSLTEPANVRILGSQALHLCHTATGTFIRSVSYEAKAWDDAAGALIVSEAGGFYENRFESYSWVELAASNMNLDSVAFSPGEWRKLQSSGDHNE